MTGNEIRKQFLDYFQQRDHRVVRSSSLVPQDDPTLLFINAGMVQFKRTFLGEEKRDYLRAATSQKCVRAGGKHNDLENVGYTARHHTFFEMLGNFSFGDYFKEKAIAHAWDLLVNGYGLPADLLYASVYLDDDEAYDIWEKQIGVPAQRIVRFGEADNFWSMGDTGPCGPCSEILIDRGEEYGCDRPDCRVGCECDRYLEIWNLVFMQFNRDADGTMTPLPKPSIDTGMGLERIVSVIQDVSNNYETDLMLPIIRMTESLSERPFGSVRDDDIAMKVIADHTRAAAFLIGDGVLPSNEGRGYVLRRIMRRAIRYGRNIGLEKPFLYQTADVVFDLMKDAYPELHESSAFISNVIKNEEMRFSETLDNGLRLLNETLADLRAKGERRVPGNLIFKLYDTYGFPVDIVRDVIREEDFSLDMEGFDDEMAQQRARSRNVTAFREIGEAYRDLTSTGVRTEFAGYDGTAGSSRVLLLVHDGAAVESVSEGQEVELVAESTPFYGEAGGQVGDVGTITGDRFELTVSDTVKDPTGLIIHKGNVVQGEIHTGDSISLRVDESKRAATARNHTATHILHAVLREVLGDHVKQAGSRVAPDRLRFDFSHFSQIDSEQLEEIEVRVNRRIRENTSMHSQEMDAEEAMRSGAIALFEEKYGDVVRVVSLSDFSRELCGGTHAARTGDIGAFKILSESSVASGVRRIEAVTGESAINSIQQESRLLRDTARLLKESPDRLKERVEKMLVQQKILEKELDGLKAKLAAQSLTASETEIQQVNGVQLIAKKIEAESPAALREAADRFKDKIGSGIVVLGSAAGGKVFLIVGVTPDLTKKYPAGSIIRELAPMVGGGGGGRPDMAQAGGTRMDQLEPMLASVPDLIRGM